MHTRLTMQMVGPLSIVALPIMSLPRIRGVNECHPLAQRLRTAFFSLYYIPRKLWRVGDWIDMGRI